MDLEPGVRVGSYEIVAPLGRGGMGDVYRALDTRLNRPVAITVLDNGPTVSLQRAVRERGAAIDQYHLQLARRHQTIADRRF